MTASRAYYAYGAERSATGDLQTDHTFTGQKSDATGLMYYNARYYDPALGTFISPDSMVPGAGQVINYNRFLYARGNPFKYTDPTGHDPFSQDWVDAFKAARGGREPDAYDRRDRLASVTTRGPVTGSLIWEESDWQFYQVNKPAILRVLVASAGIRVDRTWDLTDIDKANEYMRVSGGVLELANKIGCVVGGGVAAGLARLKNRLGGKAIFSRAEKPGIALCTSSQINPRAPACAKGAQIEFYDAIFDSTNELWVGGTVVHELAHAINNQFCVPVGDGQCKDPVLFFPGWDAKNNRPVRDLTSYAETGGRGEYWAEALAVWVYGDNYNKASLYRVQERAIEMVMQR